LAFRTSQPYTSAQFTIYFSLNKSAVHISKRSAKLTQSTRCARIAGERERERDDDDEMYINFFT
jgi:hypothetical protein